MSDSLRPHGILQARILEWLPFPSPGHLPNPGIKPRSPALQVDSLPAEPQGKSKNTGVGSLSLFQQIFPTQEWNWGLLHCRWILYLLSYLGSPCVCVLFIYLLSIIDLVLVSHVQQSDSVIHIYSFLHSLPL